MPKNSTDTPTLDRMTVHGALKQNAGNIAAAHRLLKKAINYKGSVDTLERFIHKDGPLRSVWIEQSSEYSLVEMPAQLTPDQERELEFEMAKREQDMIDAGNMEEMFGEDTEEALTFSKFAEQSFGKSINFIHGLAVKDAMALHKRAEWIVDNVLLNEDEVDKLFIADDGTKVEYRGPKYTEEDKLKWQQEYREIIAELRKFADTANNAAVARIRAREIQNRIDDGEGSGKSSRGGRAFKG